MANKILEEILNILCDDISDIDKIKVKKACLGLGYTGVKLDSGHAGVCHTLHSEMSFRHCTIVDKAGSLAGSTAISLAQLATSWNLAERILGVATINALSQIIFERKPRKYKIKEGNVIDEVTIKRNDAVAMVGFIRPFKSLIESKTDKLYILERNPAWEEEILPDVACDEILPRVDVVIITGSAIANGTLDRVLELSQRAREIAISGPSASFIPDPLFKRKVKVIGGIQVTNPDRMLNILTEGGGTPQLKTALKLVVIKPKVEF